LVKESRLSAITKVADSPEGGEEMTEGARGW
jgi:hypothetical protein